ncbi:MAG: hypothetical protein M3Y87_37645 [Myxococcota bacterium]|nr:hypothetical protein [Myxococcota bacterium]
MSESRGVGLCTWKNVTCRADERIDGWLDECEESAIGPCACAIPLDGALEPNVGWLVTAHGCAAYRAAYPETISCRGRGGAEIP